MDLKKTAMEQVMKLMQNPKVMQAASDPRVMGTVMKAMQLRGQVGAVASVAAQSVAKSLNLATREEVRELRRTVRRLQEELAQRDEAAEAREEHEEEERFEGEGGSPDHAHEQDGGAGRGDADEGNDGLGA